MSKTTLIIAALFSASSLFATGAIAQDTAASDKAEQKAATPVKPHSHVEEKTGFRPPAPDQQAKPNPAHDRTKHVHQRDMK